MKKEMICISCPKGCRMTVEFEYGKVVKVDNNLCAKGEAYAIAEITNPMRIVTSTVKVKGGVSPVVPVKTDVPIRKKLIFPVMDEIFKAIVEAPVKEGQILIKNPAKSGADIIATLGIEKK